LFVITLSSAFDYFNGFLGVPIIILDENRGFVKTVLRKDGGVSFEGELEFALYPHLVKDVARSRVKETRIDVILPIIICKHKSLPQAVQALEEGTRRILARFEKYLHDDPTVVIKQLMLTQVSQRMNDGR
jgi:hypothetical protein